MSKYKSILVDSDHPFFKNKEKMLYKEFNSDFKQIRYYTFLIVQKAPLRIKEINLLEQQISELIKNAVKHGNKNDKNKKVKVWYEFDENSAHLIIEDEGEGFTDLEKWNDFNKKRNECFKNKDFSEMEKYVSFKTEKSDSEDGGNALFAAVEYWNEGIVFNERKNAVAVKRKFLKLFV